jgi:hypothetical protein
MSRSAVRVRSSALFFTLFCREYAKRRKGPGEAGGPIYTYRTLTCLGKCAVHSRSGLVLHSRLHVTVDAERHAEAGIAQGILDSELHNHLRITRLTVSSVKKGMSGCQPEQYSWGIRLIL